MNYKILITGTNRGLGLAMLKIYLAQGHIVFTINRRVNDDLQNLKAKYTDHLNMFTGDVTDEPSIIKAISCISNKTSAIDLLINNAAILFPADNVLIEQVDFSVYEQTFQVNSIGPLKVIKHALPLVRQGQGKRIVNISSEAGSIADAWRKSEYAYCMSKSALNMASRILQNYVEKDGIKVLAIQPGWFSSDMGTSRAPITPDQAAQKVVAVLQQPFELTGPMFYDNDGNVLNW
ncbi:SDR family NAD(P)-dependent oxidoreductase [candidate division KSB1 bacterium]|nr:SDR family NAD(P)-dependent oxidoreductase [candidate division KSB1 bacterium]